jgi:hypothetical protein
MHLLKKVKIKNKYMPRATTNGPIDFEGEASGISPNISGREIPPLDDSPEDKDEPTVVKQAPVKKGDHGLTELDEEKLKEIDPKLQDRVVSLISSGVLHMPGKVKDMEAYNAFLEAEKVIRDRKRFAVRAKEDLKNLPFTGE